MQIVINIPEDTYNEIINAHPNMSNMIEQQIKMGTVLSKHGRLIDADALIKDVGVGKPYCIVNGLPSYICASQKDIHNAPTILEANK